MYFTIRVYQTDEAGRPVGKRLFSIHPDRLPRLRRAEDILELIKTRQPTALARLEPGFDYAVRVFKIKEGYRERKLRRPKFNFYVIRQYSGDAVVDHITAVS